MSQKPKAGRVRACHKQIAEVAKAACGELYEVFMSSDNRVYQIWKEDHPGLSSSGLERTFIEKNWPQCIDFARATLAHMLGRPDIDEKVKEQIHEVLVLDGSLGVGRYTREEAMQRLQLSMLPTEEGWRH